MDSSSTPTGSSSASTGSAWEGAPTTTTPSGTSALVVGLRDMERKSALAHNLLIRRNAALTPYIPDHWHSELLAAGLLARYPTIPRSLIYGFEAGIPYISQTFTPPNHPSLLTHIDVFTKMVNLEFEKGRYFGPLSREQVEAELGPFQTSPISIIPKPGQPDKFRIIQNLLHPRQPPIASVNSAICCIPDNLQSRRSTPQLTRRPSPAHGGPSEQSAT